MKTVYCLKTREDESQSWGEAEYYRTRKERDADERLMRCLFGIRTFSFEEKKTLEEIEESFD